MISNSQNQEEKEVLHMGDKSPKNKEKKKKKQKPAGASSASPIVTAVK